MLNVRLLQEAKDRLSQFSQSLQGGTPTFQPTIFTELSRSRLEDFNLLDTLGSTPFFSLVASPRLLAHRSPAPRNRNLWQGPTVSKHPHQELLLHENPQQGEGRALKAAGARPQRKTNPLLRQTPLYRRTVCPSAPFPTTSSSNPHQILIKSSSNRHQILIKSSSNPHQIIIKSSSNRHQIVIKSSSNRHQIVIKSSSNHHCVACV